MPASARRHLSRMIFVFFQQTSKKGQGFPVSKWSLYTRSLDVAINEHFEKLARTPPISSEISSGRIFSLDRGRRRWLGQSRRTCRIGLQIRWNIFLLPFPQEFDAADAHDNKNAPLERFRSTAACWRKRRAPLIEARHLPNAHVTMNEDAVSDRCGERVANWIWCALPVPSLSKESAPVELL